MSRTAEKVSNDYFIERDGERFAGLHLIVDLVGAQSLDDRCLIEHTLRRCAIVAGATVLHCYLHQFGSGGGISGVLVLAESHISIHTWPERHFAALDVFMCGDTHPEAAIPVLEAAFAPTSLKVQELRRGNVGAK